MYYLLIFGLFALSESRWANVHYGYDYRHGLGYQKPKKNDCCIEDPTQNIVDNLKAADEIVRQFCTDDYNAREVFDFEGYRLKYTFKHDIEDSTKLSINYRVVHVDVKLEDGVEVTDMRILPPGLQTSDAVWRVDADELILTIPYKSKSEVEIALSCNKGEEWIDSVVNVPLSPEYTAYSYYRNGFSFVNPALVEIN